MRTTLLSTIALTAALGLAAGCSNPADNVPEAQVAPATPTAAEPTPTAPASAPGSTPTAADAAAALGVMGAAVQEGTAVTLPIREDSTITWVGSKVTGRHDGGFNEFEGEIRLVPGAIEASSVVVTIDTTSLWSDTERLTGHLKSADFFEVDTYPTATFTSTKIAPMGDHYMVTGNLDLHGVTKSITFPATLAVEGDTVAAQAEFAIKRFDWGIAYKGKADDLIRDEVVVRFDLKAGTAA